MNNNDYFDYMIIYKVTHINSGFVYIGQTTKTMSTRWSQHVSDSKKPERSKNIKFLNALAKYGASAFIIEQIDSCSSIDELNVKEQFWIRYYNSLSPNGYNLNTGGLNRTVSEETRKKFSQRVIKQVTKDKIRAKRIGTKASPETKKIMSIRRSGSGNVMFGKTHSENSRSKISSNRIGKYGGENNPKAKLTWEKVDEIRAKFIPRKYTSLMLAKEYGVRHTCIIKIVHFKTWIPNAQN